MCYVVLSLLLLLCSPQRELKRYDAVSDPWAPCFGGPRHVADVSIDAMNSADMPGLGSATIHALQPPQVVTNSHNINSRGSGEDYKHVELTQVDRQIA